MKIKTTKNGVALVDCRDSAESRRENWVLMCADENCDCVYEVWGTLHEAKTALTGLACVKVGA